MEQLTHKSIVASYKMYDITDGKEVLLEETNADQPLKFITDLGMMPITALEDVLKEKSAGETFDITILPENAFGEYVAERVIDLDKQIFCTNGVFNETQVHEGVIVPLQSEDGQRFMAQVVKVAEDKVTVDLNHPLAGKTIRFCGTVNESADATDEEVMAILNAFNHHGGCGHCSGHCHEEGGCDSCGGGCNNGGCGNCKHDE